MRERRRKHLAALVAAGGIAAFPVLARPNGIRPPRTEFVYDVACQTGGGEKVVKNARVTGLEAGRKLSELRVKGDAAARDVALPLKQVESIVLEKSKGTYAKAILIRTDGSGDERIQLRVRTATGPVRMSAFGSREAVELASCTRVTVSRREAAESEGSGHAAKK
jgi:hypothetical protein